MTPDESVSGVRAESSSGSVSVRYGDGPLSRSMPTTRETSRDTLSEILHEAGANGVDPEAECEYSDDGEDHGREIRTLSAVCDGGRPGTTCFACSSPGTNRYTLIIDGKNTQIEKNLVCKACLAEFLLTEEVEVRTEGS